MVETYAKLQELCNEVLRAYMDKLPDLVPLSQISANSMKIQLVKINFLAQRPTIMVMSQMTESFSKLILLR